MQRYQRPLRAIRDAVVQRAAEIDIRQFAGTDYFRPERLEQGSRRAEGFFGQFAFDDAVGAPYIVAVHRALLARQPGDRGEHEIVVGIHVQEVAHVARRVADAVLRPEPAGALAGRRAQRRGEFGLVHLSRGAKRPAEGLRCPGQWRQVGMDGVHLEIGL